MDRPKVLASIAIMMGDPVTQLGPEVTVMACRQSVLGLVTAHSGWPGSSMAPCWQLSSHRLHLEARSARCVRPVLGPISTVLKNTRGSQSLGALRPCP